jgi:hypothetical protein
VALSASLRFLLAAANATEAGGLEADEEEGALSLARSRDAGTARSSGSGEAGLAGFHGEMAFKTCDRRGTIEIRI